MTQEAAPSKKASWSLDTDTGTARVDMPSGLVGLYDLSDLFTADWSELHTVDQYLVYYGFKQKASDATARESSAKLTDQERLDVFQAVYDRLKAGDWNAKVTPADREAAVLKRCETEAEMRVLEKVLPYVTAEGIARELLRREAE